MIFSRFIQLLFERGWTIVPEQEDFDIKQLSIGPKGAFDFIYPRGKIPRRL